MLMPPSASPALQDTLKLVVRRLSAIDNLAIVLRGSLAQGRADQYSDIDLAVVDATGSAEPQVAATLLNSAPVLAHFRATHLNLPNLLITFFHMGDQVVKVDAHVLLPHEFQRTPADLVLHDPLELLQSRDIPSASVPDLAISDLDQKFSGWIWYTYT